ncbi:hypothetical protein GJU37_29555, partial [Klebsiella pneumoniae]|nr:hypothetical protein [Klebsiella pneumoniae]
MVVEDGPDMKIRLAEITAAVNPLLAAASPLLCALAQMPRELSPGFVEHYRALLEREVRRYQTLCDQQPSPRTCAGCALLPMHFAGRSRQQHHLGGGAVSGAGKSLLVTFHGESEGGIKLFSDNWASGRKLPGAQRC